MVKNRKGFTLIEVIVVMLILTLVMSVTVPSIMSYANDGEKARIMTQTREIMIAAQAACIKQLSENPADYKKVSNLYTIRNDDYYKGLKAGRVTSYLLCFMQKNNPVSKKTTATETEKAIALAVLKYLGSEDYRTAVYKFVSTRNPLGVSVASYENSYKQPGINVVFREDGYIAFVEYGRDGWLCHLDNKGHMQMTKNGVFSKDPQ